MKKLLFTLFFLALSFQLCYSQISPIIASSSIEKVTVFVSSAQIFRKASISLVKGKNEIEFRNLSPYIDKQSIVVGCKGGVTVVSVNNQIKTIEALGKLQELKKLEDEKSLKLSNMKLNQNLMKVYQTEESILLKNQIMNNEHVVLKAIDLKDMADFQRNRLTEIYLKQLELGKIIDAIDSNLQKIDKQIFALNSKTEQTKGIIKLILNATVDGNYAIDFSYIVPNAGWFANYDLRVRDVNSPIDLKLKANVFQQTGEDWKDVKISLANNNPSENTIAPILPVWMVNRSGSFNVTKPINNYVLNNQINEVKGKVFDAYTNLPIAFANVIIEGSSMGTITDENGNFTIKVSPLSENLIIKNIGYEDYKVTIYSSYFSAAMQPIKNKLQQVVVSYKKPLINENYVQTEKMISGKSMSSDDIKRAPVRDINSLVSAGVGAYQKDNSSVQIGGSRSLGSRIIVDGQPLRGNAIIPLDAKLEYNEIELDVIYDIALPYSIPADGKSYQVEIKNFEIPAYYEYFAVPKLDKYAYLTAHVANWQELKLLDGEINLFLEGKYIGKSVLQTHFANDTLNISLGKDNNIFIERKRVKDFSKNQLLGENRTQFSSFETEIKNNKNYPIHLKIEDQYPLSTERSVDVTELGFTSGGKLDNETKKIVWDIDLSSKEEKKLEIKYSVKYPKGTLMKID